MPELALLLLPVAALAVLDRVTLRAEPTAYRRGAWALWALYVVPAPLLTMVIALVEGRPALGAQVGSALGLLVVVAVAPTWLDWRAFRRSLDEIVRDPERRDALLDASFDAMDRLRRERSLHDAMGRVHAASETLLAAGLDVEADRLAERASAWSLPPKWAPAIAMTRAWIALRASDVERARELVASVRTRPFDRRWVEPFALFDAHLELASGDTAAALARAREHDRGPRRAWWLALRAHALAATGDVEGARIALCELRELREPQMGLRQVAAAALPASRLAAELDRGEAHPFR